MIDWSKAPRWAQYAAMDSDGIWFWYSRKPELGNYEWLLTGGKYAPSLGHEFLGVWEGSRQERPHD
jgi:hypothetical protein